MATTTTRLTIEDFEKLPDDRARNHELVEGQLVDVSGNTLGHNRVREYLARRLGQYVDEHKLGEVVTEQEYDFDGNAHGPDVTFVRADRVALGDRKLRVQRFVPDLVVEIVSARDQFNAVMRKAQRYRRCGVRDVWVLTTETRQALLFSQSGDKLLSENDSFQSNLIPGFCMALNELFDRE